MRKTNSNFIFSENQIKNYNVVTSFRERLLYKDFTGKSKVCFISQVIFQSLLLASWPGRCVSANVGYLLFQILSWWRGLGMEGRRGC